MMHNEAFRQLGLDFAYLTFDVGTDQLKTAVENLVSYDRKGLIFDVRGNGGGTVESVREIVDYL